MTRENRPLPRDPSKPDTAPPPVELTFRSRRVLRTVFLVCVLLELAFPLLDYHINYARLTEISAVRNFFNTAREDALPSWFGVTQTTLVALTVWLIYLAVRRQERSRWVRVGWLIFAIFFSYMALDDGAEFHERMGSTFREVETQASRSAGEMTTAAEVIDAFPSYPWQILFVPVFGAMGLLLLALVWREMRGRSSRLLVLAALGCFAFAVGLDFIEGLEDDHPWNLYTALAARPGMEQFTDDRFGRDAFESIRHFSKSIEESIEMFGMTLLWLVFLHHFMTIAADLRVRFVPAAATPAARAAAPPAPDHARPDPNRRRPI